MISCNDLRPGMGFKYEDKIYVVLDTTHNKSARGQMVIKIKAKNLRTGAITELTMTGGDKVATIRIEKKEMQYLYDDGLGLVFMDTETYDQVSVEKTKLEWEMNFLKENSTVEIAYYEDEIIGINLPSKVVLKVVETEPAIRGDTAKTATKEAKLETGYVIRVPLFIEQGEDVIVSTDTGSYDSRA